MKKRIIAVLLATTMVLGSAMAGCGNSNGESSKSSASKSENSKSEDSSAGSTSAVSEEHGPSSEAAPAWDKFDKLIHDIRREVDPAKRESMMHEAEDMLMDTWTAIPLYYYNKNYLQSTDVTGVYANLFGYKFFQYAQALDNKLSMNLGPEPAKLDPALNSAVDGAILSIMGFSGLYTFNDKGEHVPDLAEDYEMSEDGLTYTFTVRDGLKWSNGDPLNAKDFEYSWNRLADPKTGADYSYLTDIINKKDDGKLDIEASEDGKTFTVKLVAPCPYFLDLAAFPAFFAVPQKRVEAAEGADSNPGAWALEAGFVGSGPFLLKEWKHNESMLYVKNPNYYNADKVSIEEIQLMLSDDHTAIFNAFKDGSLNYADVIPTDEMKNVKDTPEYHVIPNLGTYYCAFNVNSDLFKGKTVQQAADMRHAMSLLIDRQYIVDTVAQADQELANTFVPAAMEDGNGEEFRKNDDDYTYPDKENVGYYDPNKVDVKGAIELLKKAGFEFDGEMLSSSTPINMTYAVNEGSGNVKIAEAIQQDLAQIGINVDVETKEWSVFQEERKNGVYDFQREGWIADYNDPINMLEIFESTSGNNNSQLGK